LWNFLSAPAATWWKIKITFSYGVLTPAEFGMELAGDVCRTLPRSKTSGASWNFPTVDLYNHHFDPIEHLESKELVRLSVGAAMGVPCQ
jgi:hypothetical protein